MAIHPPHTLTYKETIHYLYDKLPLYSSIGLKAYKADLNNTIALCRHLDNPQSKIKTIHIAGTNGKGSTSHMLASIFQQQGYKTGLYTSPHLKDFRERIKINGEMISPDFVIDFVQKTKYVSNEIQPSFFELTFVMALEYFANKDVDIAIIETGLGGRLDSTNVITPVVSVITNIGFDHMDILGDSLSKIAFEKAGIIKPNIPVVIGETTAETKPVFLNKAAETNSVIFFADEKYATLSFQTANDFLHVEVFDNEINKKVNYRLDLTGRYQAKNLLTVLATLDILKKYFLLEPGKTLEALSKVTKLSGLHGRWEIINHKPTIVLDVAHNVDGIRQLINQVDSSNYIKLHIVFGMVKDKEIEKVLELLPKSAAYYFTKAQIPRALPEAELYEKAAAFKLKGNYYSEVNKALKAAVEASSPGDMIIVCGSVFVVGEVNVENLKSPK